MKFLFDSRLSGNVIQLVVILKVPLGGFVFYFFPLENNKMRLNTVQVKYLTDSWDNGYRNKC